MHDYYCTTTVCVLLLCTTVLLLLCVYYYYYSVLCTIVLCMYVHHCVCVCVCVLLCTISLCVCVVYHCCCVLSLTPCAQPLASLGVCFSKTFFSRGKALYVIIVCVVNSVNVLYGVCLLCSILRSACLSDVLHVCSLLALSLSCVQQ